MTDLNGSSKDPTKLLVLCGLFAALITVGTLISIPLAGGHGYINLGDAFIHAAAFVIGGWHCAAVAAVGSAIADLILGYGIYVPGTVIIKALTAFVCFLLLRKLRFKPLACIISGLIVPLGYLAYELMLSAFGAFEAHVAFFDLTWNMIQYAVCAVIGIIAVSLIGKIPYER